MSPLRLLGFLRLLGLLGDEAMRSSLLGRIGMIRDRVYYLPKIAISTLQNSRNPISLPFFFP